MTDALADAYPEAAPYIQRAVDEHGEEWVLANYYERLYPLAQVMAMPHKEELPFYDPERHETMSRADLTAMYRGWAVHRENLRTGHKPED